MERQRALVLAILVFGSSTVAAAQSAAPPPPVLTPSEMEAFLLNAQIVKLQRAAKGVTGSDRATLRQGDFVHDVHVQYIDEARQLFEAGRASEVNFRDSFRYNIAGYRFAQLIGLQIVPMSVERRVKGRRAAVTWWVDDVQFDEAGRLALTSRAWGPDPTSTMKQIHIMRVWDELIQNRDRNQQNILWTNDWTMWLIDHTRAFRRGDRLLKPEQLTRCDRGLFERLKQLTPEALAGALQGVLLEDELTALLKRRDALVRHFETLIAERGEPAVLFWVTPR